MNDLALPKRRNWLLIILGLAVGVPVLIFGGVIIVAAIVSSRMTPAEHAAAKANQDYQAFRDITEGAIRASMFDPASTQFRNVAQGASAAVVCGKVNAKNGFGGYGPYKRFYSNKSVPILEIEPSSDSHIDGSMAFEKHYKLNCPVGP